VVEALGEEADGAFCRACHLASGGNPFYLRELVLEAERQGIEPVAAEAGRVGGLGPPAISRATVERLARLHRDELQSARAGFSVPGLSSIDSRPKAAATP
jgi:hypothetical protein